MTNTRFRRLILILALLAVSAVSVIALRRERVIDAWKPTNYLVRINLNEQLSEISTASVNIEILALKKLSLIELDFGELTTERVLLDSKPVPFVHRNEKLVVTLPVPVNAGTRLVLTVDYHGKPKDGLILTADKDGKPAAIGDNWPNRVHHWIPSFDHPSAKATVTFNINAPAGRLVVANGKFDKVETAANGTRTWTYTEKTPIPPYCMIIGVGDFLKLEPTQKASTPLSYYVPHSDGPYAMKGFGPAISILDFFNQKVAPYPYEKLALIVGATRFGGMENSSAIVFTSTLFNPNPKAKLSNTFGIPSGTVGLVAHEIAHQWFGDSVTESTWSDLWLSEGFATYFAGLFIQQYEGEAAFQAYMQQAAETSLRYEKTTRTPIFDRETEDLLKLLNGNNYQKGAWVLHMLRSRLGDEAFFSGIKSYYQAHANSTASSEDLRKALEKASGKELRAFFDRWIYDSGHPQYELSWQWQQPKGLVQFSLKQVQAGAVFLDPVELKIKTSTGDQQVILTPGNVETFKEIRLKEKPTAIEIDPRNTLLKEAIVNEKL